MVVMSFHRSSNNISMCFFFPLYKNEENSYGSCQYRFVTAVFLNLCNCNFGWILFCYKGLQLNCNGFNFQVNYCEHYLIT
jgi:hypothetical protein